MKSAYELAMERLEKAAPTKKLTPEQIANIQEIDSVFKAKIAERETMAQAAIAAAKAANSIENVRMLQGTLAQELRKLRDECEEKKEKVRNSA
jgi:hypothetical protein